MCKKGHYMKNKNIRGNVFCQLILISKKGPNAKNVQKCKKLSNIEKFSSLVSLTRHFTKFIFLEKLTAMSHFNMQNMLLFFLSSHHDTNPLLHLYHFRKKFIIIYWLILTVNHKGSNFLFFFFFFLSSSSGSSIFVPQQIL